MSQPLLSLCMIVRDSARTLPACLASIAPWVDEIVVVDTGSSDETREIARQFGARVFEFPWIDDFAAARNESLRHATGEWLFWMDSDDTIDETNGKQLRALAASAHDPATLGYVIQVHCPTKTDSGQVEVTVVDHVKLFRNDARLQFEGRIHEQILPSIRVLGGDVGWTDLFVEHSGSDQSPEGKRRKVERDLRILKLDLADRPDHPFVLFNLGMTYEDIGEYSQAETWLRRCLEHSCPGESHIRKAYALLASSLERQGHGEEALGVCQKGLALFSEDSELLFRQGVLQHRLDRLEEAVASYRVLLHATPPRHFTSVDRGIGGYKARHNLALVFTEQGDHRAAEREWRHVLSANPRFSPAVRGLGQSLIAQRKLSALGVLLDEWTGESEQEADRHWLRGLAAERAGELDTARNLFERALALDSHHDQARQDLCRWLFHHGTLPDAEAALRELVERSPEKGAPLHNLGIVLSRQGRRSEAIEAFQASLIARPDSLQTREQLEQLLTSRVLVPTSPPGKNGEAVNSSFLQLPECFARRLIPGESSKCHCLHPMVHARDQIVSAGMCGICERWSDSPRPALRSEHSLVSPNRGLSCRYFGTQIGLRTCDTCAGNVQVKVFECTHERHIDTTLDECRSCVDFVLSPATTRDPVTSQ
jgi:tetratricopeptide (TPR) repeat protein